MATVGLRVLKKERARRHIGDTAARLFAERGYEQVAVSDVAAAAEVSEQTVYNYFGTKEQLVTDRDQQIQDRLCALILARPPSQTPVAAVRDFVLASVDAIGTIAPDLWLGELGHLAAISPTVHRLVLDMGDRQAAALAQVILATGDVEPEVATLQGMALAGVYQILISQAGQRARKGEDQARIARDLRPVVTNVLNELERWFRASDASWTRGGPPATAGQM